MGINTEKISEMVKKHTPEILTVWPMIHMLEEQYIVNDRRLKALEESYGIVNKELEKYRHRVMRRTRSNNWLRLHGYPMRRGKENGDLKD